MELLRKHSKQPSRLEGYSEYFFLIDFFLMSSSSADSASKRAAHLRMRPSTLHRAAKIRGYSFDYPQIWNSGGTSGDLKASLELIPWGPPRVKVRGGNYWMSDWNVTKLLYFVLIVLIKLRIIKCLFNYDGINLRCTLYQI